MNIRNKKQQSVKKHAKLNKVLQYVFQSDNDSDYFEVFAFTMLGR